MINKLIIFVAAVALGACGNRPGDSYHAFQCVNDSTGITLDHVSINSLSEMKYGFDGIDSQNYLHTVSKQDAPNWKCKLAEYKFGRDELQ